MVQVSGLRSCCVSKVCPSALSRHSSNFLEDVERIFQKSNELISNEHKPENVYKFPEHVIIQALNIKIE